ncbi:MAG TPA: hypothetical protein VKU02_03625 [Gemmataceae bacterium]|nr:hypothetical protein [Gemmataceae bacterium]
MSLFWQQNSYAAFDRRESVLKTIASVPESTNQERSSDNRSERPDRALTKPILDTLPADRDLTRVMAAWTRQPAHVLRAILVLADD